MIELDSRLVPSVVVANHGLVEGRFGDPLYTPFADYSGPMDVASLGEYTVAAAVNRVQLKHNNDVILDRYVFEDAYTGGLSVALTPDKLIVGASLGGPRVQEYNLHGVQLDDRFVFESSFRGGVTVRSFSNHIIIAANSTGGLVAEVDGEQHFYGPTDFRGQRVWGLADTAFVGQPVVLVQTGSNLASFDLSGNQLTAALTQTAYTSIAAGSFTFPGRNMVIASNGDGYDEIDTTTGIVLQQFHDTHADRVGQTEVQEPYPGSDMLVPYSNSGGSVGSDLGTGTITAPVWIDGVIYGLTNRHVAGTGNVVIPGRADGPPQQTGQVVRYSEFLGHVDAAIFTTTLPIDTTIIGTVLNHYTNQLYTVTIHPTGLAQLHYGEVAYKVGRTTGLTVGVNTNDDWAGTVNYGSFTVNYTGQNNIFGFNSPFAEPGDSGSPVLVYDHGWKLAGQLFAGGSLNGIVTNISDVLSTLNVEYRP